MLRKSLGLIVLCLLTINVMSQKPTSVPPGFDLWQTVGSGATLMKFAESPIPAGFFCQDSAAFTGHIDFDGLPLETEPAGALDKTDTIVERLDEAVIDENGFAHSRLQVSALSLKSRAPLDTECGSWDVIATLAGKQPITEITYQLEDDASGSFSAELVINVKLSFHSRTEKGLVRELTRTVHFGGFDEVPFKMAPASAAPAGKRDLNPEVKVDTDGNRVPDRMVQVVTVTHATVAPAWYYTNGWICPLWYTGVPMNPPCIRWASVHTAPTHSHVTLPGAPKWPTVACDDAILANGRIKTLATATILADEDCFSLVEQYQSLKSQLQPLYDSGYIMTDPETIAREFEVKENQ